MRIYSIFSQDRGLILETGLVLDQAIAEREIHLGHH